MKFNDILNNYRKIAVIGYSVNPARPSNWISEYLVNNGYEVYGVNPGLEGRCVNRINCYRSILDIPDKVEIVNVFRRPDALPDLMNEILSLDYKPEVIWTQIGVISEEARKAAEDNGIEYVENRCIYVEHQKL